MNAIYQSKNLPYIVDLLLKRATWPSQQSNTGKKLKHNTPTKNNLIDSEAKNIPPIIHKIPDNIVILFAEIPRWIKIQVK